VDRFISGRDQLTRTQQAEAIFAIDCRFRRVFHFVVRCLTRESMHQLTIDDGPKFPNPWPVRRMVELQIAKMLRAARSVALAVQLI